MTFTVHGIDGFLHLIAALGCIGGRCPGFARPGQESRHSWRSRSDGQAWIGHWCTTRCAAPPTPRARCGQRRTDLSAQAACRAVRTGRGGSGAWRAGVTTPLLPTAPCEPARRAGRRFRVWPGSLRMRRSGSQRSLASSPRGLAAFRS